MTGEERTAGPGIFKNLEADGFDGSARHPGLVLLQKLCQSKLRAVAAKNHTPHSPRRAGLIASAHASTCL